jgi:hypothetical protein
MKSFLSIILFFSSLYVFAQDTLYFLSGDKQVVELCRSEIPEKVGQLAEANTFHGVTVLYRKAIMPAWNEELWTGEEYEYNMRLAAAGCKFGKLDEIVYWYRIHKDQKSLIYKSDDSEMILRRYRFIRDVIQINYVNSHFRIVR